jgi:sulfur carrier protein
MSEEIRVNGEALPLPGPALIDLLATLGLDPEAGGIAIALNGEVVSCSDWATTRLGADDEIEIIRATQGG